MNNIGGKEHRNFQPRILEVLFLKHAHIIGTKNIEGTTNQPLFEVFARLIVANFARSSKVSRVLVHLANLLIQSHQRQNRIDLMLDHGITAVAFPY